MEPENRDRRDASAEASEHTLDGGAREFAELFHGLYVRFHRRDPVDGYRPSPETLAVMEHMVRSGPMTVTEAAAHFGRSQAAMSEILARMEQREIVARIRDERDRRRTLVWLSPKGLEVHRRATRVLCEGLLDRALATMEDDQRQALLDSMRALLHAPHDSTR